MKSKKIQIENLESYSRALEEIKNDIQQSQLRAAQSITKELTMLYWRIGKMLSEKIDQDGWGSKTLKRLTSDLKTVFPNISGFSIRNLHYMRKFAERLPDCNCAAAAAQIPWGHNMLLRQ